MPLITSPHDAATAAESISVGMGQIGVAQAPTRLTAVLGSCIGVVLYSVHHGAGAMAHVVLPRAGKPTPQPGKFADTALPAMLAELAKLGIQPRELSVKIAGGANMFGTTAGPMQIGAANAEAVRAAVSYAGLRLVGEHLGGKQGRRVAFAPGLGVLQIEIIGEEPFTL